MEKSMTQINKYTKKDGTSAYMFNAYVGRNPRTGKNVYRKRQGFKTKKQAQIALAEILKDVDENGIESDNSNIITFQDLYDLWIDQQKLNVKTSSFIDQKSFVDNHVLPFLGKMKLNEITVVKCQQLVNKAYDSGLKRYSYVRSVTAQIMRFGESLDILKDNSMKRTILPRKKQEEEKLKYYTKEELTTFFHYLKDNSNFQQLTFFRILAFTGARKSEIMALQWKDIDFKNKTITIDKTVAKDFNNTITIQSPKTHSSIRTLSIDDETIQLIKRWRVLQRSDYLKMGFNTSSDEQFLFTDRKNQLHKLAIPNQWLKSILTKYELPKITPHHFRHTHASLLLQAGIPVKEVSERLGHKDITITLEIYSHVMPEEQEKTASKFANFVGF
ncbi:tyrosine-type recombinase/integrase [Enterococcus olivae]